MCRVLDFHQCEWHRRWLALQAELEAAVSECDVVTAERDALINERDALINERDALVVHRDALLRVVFGKKSEAMSSKDRDLRDGEPSRKNGAGAQRKRRKNAETRAGLGERTVKHLLPASGCTCPHCGDVADRPVGKGRETVIYEYIPARMERQRHVQQTLACRCGQLVLTAPGPARVFDKTPHGPALVAQIVVARTLDIMPFYRQEKQFCRLGIPLNRSTMCESYHRAAGILEPIYACVMAEIVASRVVMGDETRLKRHGVGGGESLPGYMWTFRTADHIGYVYDATRGGAVPLDVLGTSTGVLVTDAYGGYSPLYSLKYRVRGGCLAHVRRKFHEVRTKAESLVKEVLDLILDVYRVEATARERDILGTPAHRALRQETSRPIMDRLHERLLEERSRWTPRGVVAKAIAYALNQWEDLCLFLDDEHVPPDNNLSENALRIIALGRKNWQLVGHEGAGQNTAILQTLVACCVLADVNPHEYLADVLIRVQTHPQKDVAELLPERWKAAREAERRAREAESSMEARAA